MTLAARAHRWVDRWWHGEAGVAGAVADLLLAPGELGYRAAMGARNAAFDHGWVAQRRASIPVISVGNISSGGSGKTPFAAWLAARLRAMGIQPAIAMRGYGADETELHRELNPDVPVFVAADRVIAVDQAARAGCACVILDDGFQHRRLRRDLDIVLVSAEQWAPRPRLLPRGPWREPPSSLKRADLTVVVQKTDELAADRAAEDLRHIFPATPVLRCAIEPSRLESLHLQNLPPRHFERARVLAVASLADPRPFAEHLRRMGAEVELAAFRDHHPFTPGDAKMLLKRAEGRTLVMTGKDAVKLRSLLPESVPAYVLRQRVRMLAGEEILDAALARVLSHA